MKNDNEKRDKAWRTYRDSDEHKHHGAAKRPFLAGYDAAKAEQLTIDRDALAKFLFSRDFGRRNWDDVQMGEQQVYQAEAVAVIAHLSAQEAATEVEWAVEHEDTIDIAENEAEARRWAIRIFDGEHGKLVRRVPERIVPAGPWQEAPNE